MPPMPQKIIIINYDTALISISEYQNILLHLEGMAFFSFPFVPLNTQNIIYYLLYHCYNFYPYQATSQITYKIIAQL